MAWVPALMAIIFPLIAISQASNMLQLEMQGIRVPGKVAEYAETDNSDGQWSYYAVVHFRTPGESPGETIQFRDDVGGDPPPLRVGDAVTVLYIPGAPWTAVVDRGPMANFFIPALLLVGGVFAGWVTWVMLMTRRRPVTAADAPSRAQVAAEQG
jgi:hypothetical protein